MTRFNLISLITAAVVMVGAVLGYVMFRTSPAPSDVAALLEPVEPTKNTDTTQTAPAEPVIEDAPEASLPSVALMAPLVDLMRVEPDGSTQIAGRAAPNSVVVITVDEVEIDRQTTDQNGNFVSLLDLGYSATPRRVDVTAQHGEEIATLKERLIMAANPAPEPAAKSAQVEDALTPKAPAAPTVLALSEGSATTKTGPAKTLDTISYDAKGNVVIAGTTQGPKEDVQVNVYLDNKPVLSTDVAKDGAWKAPLTDVEAGTYNLRIDQVDSAGKVVERLETPFKREDPTVLAAQLPNDREVAVVTVQPGLTLWAVAREQYGDGMLYVKVFEANKDLIRDPDLIYPGQVFSITD
ncbi:MAG: LysM peptidoglycan-binding domain-containing protein [Halocynthiibacter sp.]